MSLMRKYADIVLVAEDLTSFDAGITSATTIAETFPTEETATVKRLAKIGMKSESFAREALEVARVAEDLLPRALDLARMERTIANRDAMRLRYTRLRQLLERVEAALILLGVDAYRDGLDVYDALKRHGTDQALREAVYQLGRAFRRAQEEEEGEGEPEIPEVPVSA
jgi:hypothetical protein